LTTKTFAPPADEVGGVSQMTRDAPARCSSCSLDLRSPSKNI